MPKQISGKIRRRLKDSNLWIKGLWPAFSVWTLGLFYISRTKNHYLTLNLALPGLRSESKYPWDGGKKKDLKYAKGKNKVTTVSKPRKLKAVKPRRARYIRVNIPRLSLITGLLGLHFHVDVHTVSFWVDMDNLECKWSLWGLRHHPSTPPVYISERMQALFSPNT